MMNFRGSSWPTGRRWAGGLLVTIVLAAGVAWAAGQMMSVQVRSTKLRSRPSFLGATVAEVIYGSQVTVGDQRGPWTQVTDADGHTGWLHESALSQEKLTMVSGSAEAATGASSDEIALAGKGFNSQVEQEYREQNSSVDFATVDRMEQVVVTPEQAAAFLAAGQIQPPNGGQ